MIVLTAIAIYSAFASPVITFISPTLQDNATTGSNWVYVNLTSSENLNQSLLEWGNSTGFTNVSMSNSSATNWYLNMTNLADYTYNYTIYAQNTTGSWTQTARRFITVDSTQYSTWTIGQGGVDWTGNSTLTNATINQGTGNVELRQQIDDYISYWRADGNAKDDNTISANDGTGGIYAAGMYDKAFNVSSDATTVNIGAKESLNISYPFTVAMWVKGVDSTDGYLIANINSCTRGFWIQFMYLNPRFCIGNGTTGFTVYGSTVSAGTWNHFVGTYNGTHTLFYQNGVLQGATQVNGSMAASGQAMRIGAKSTAGYYTTSIIDDVRIYNRTLANNEINLTRNQSKYVSGNLTVWHDAGSGKATYKFDVNATTPSGTNYTTWYRQSGTGSFTPIGETYTGNNTIEIGGARYRNTDIMVTLNGNTTATPEIISVTFYTTANLPPTVMLNSPVDKFKQTSKAITFNCTAYDNINLTNVTLYNNLGGAWQANGTNTSGINDTAYIFTRTAPSNGTFTWNCRAYNNASLSSFASQNYTITVDGAPPTSNSPDDKFYAKDSSATIGWILYDNYAPGYYTVYRNGTVQNQSSWQNNTNLNIWINTSTVGIWNYTISYNDSLGNVGISDTVLIELLGGPSGCYDIGAATYNTTENTIVLNNQTSTLCTIFYDVGNKSVLSYNDTTRTYLLNAKINSSSTTTANLNISDTMLLMNNTMDDEYYLQAGWILTISNSTIKSNNGKKFYIVSPMKTGAGYTAQIYNTLFDGGWVRIAPPDMVSSPGEPIRVINTTIKNLNMDGSLIGYEASQDEAGALNIRKAAGRGMYLDGITIENVAGGPIESAPIYFTSDASNATIKNTVIRKTSHPSHSAIFWRGAPWNLTLTNITIDDVTTGNGNGIGNKEGLVGIGRSHRYTNLTILNYTSIGINTYQNMFGGDNVSGMEIENLVLNASLVDDPTHDTYFFYHYYNNGSVNIWVFNAALKNAEKGFFARDNNYYFTNTLVQNVLITLYNNIEGGNIYWYELLDALVKDSNNSAVGNATLIITPNATAPASTVVTKWFYSQTNIVTGPDGHTPLPSNENGTVAVLRERVYSGGSKSSYSYTIAAYDSNNIWTNVTHTIYPNGTIQQLQPLAQVTGVNPDSSWYRSNPNTYQNTTTLQINYTKTNITIAVTNTTNITVSEYSSAKINFTATNTTQNQKMNVTVGNGTFPIINSWQYRIKKDGIVQSSQTASPNMVTFTNINVGSEYIVESAGGNMTLSLNSPQNALLTSNATITFNCSAASSGNQLANITLYGNWSGGWGAKNATNITGTSNSSQWINTIADGSYIWNCLAYDSTGNSSYAAGNYTFTIDTTPPMAITGLANQSRADSWIFWNWTNPATDFNHSTIYLNGTWKTNTSLNYYNATGLNASNWYYLQVRTVDAAGNLNATWVNSSAETSGDATPPAITIIYPANATYGYNQSIPLNFSLSEQAFWCGYSLDSAANLTIPSCLNATFNVPTGSGQHTIRLYANDSSGNMGSSQTRYFTVDIAGPAIAFVPPTPPNGNTTANNWVYVNVSMADSESPDNLTAVIDWNRSLVLWLRFDNSSAGTFVRDYSSWNNSGTMANMNAGVDNGTTSGLTAGGRHGNAVMFDGTDDVVNITASPLFDFLSTESFTIELFAKTTNCVGTKVIFARKGLTGTWPDISIACQSDSRIWFSLGDSNANQTSIKGQNISDNSWHHIAAEYDGTNSMMYLYIDGVPVNQSSTSFTGNFTYPSNINPCIGAYRCSVSGSTYNFLGTVDDARLWRRALSAGEINASYNAGTYGLYRNFTGLADGSYTYAAHAEDAAGNANDTGTRTLTIDTVPPSHRILLPQNATYGTTLLSLNYTVLDANLDKVWYLYNNANATLTGNTTFAALNNQQSTLYLYSNDTAGNVNVTSVTFTVDTTQPKITIQSPTNTTYYTASVWFNITLNKGGSWAGFSIDGRPNSTLANSSGNWNLLNSSMSDGFHNVTFHANDTAGNMNSTSIYFTVDTSGPRFTIQSPTNTTYSTNSIWFNITLNKAGSWAGYSLDGKSNVTMANSSGNWNLLNSSMSDGFHNATFHANDTSGNMNSTSIYFVIDTTPPRMTVQSPANATYAQKWLWANLTLSEAGSWCGVSLNGTANQTMANSTGKWWLNLSVPAEGPNNATFWCNDTAGNMNSSTPVRFTIDTVKPILTFQPPTPDNNNSTANRWVYVNLTSSETLSSALLEWNGTAPNLTMQGSGANWSRNVTGLANGNYTFRVYGNDTADNWNATEARWVYVNYTYNVYRYNFTVRNATGTIIENATISVYNDSATELEGYKLNSSAASRSVDFLELRKYHLRYDLPAGQSLVIMNLTISANATISPQFVDTYAGALPAYTSARSYAVAMNDSTLSYDHAEFTLPVTGTVNRILHCTSWTFATASCSNWENNALSSYNYTLNSTTLRFNATAFDAYMAGYYDAPATPTPTSAPAAGGSSGGGGGGGGSGAPTAVSGNKTVSASVLGPFRAISAIVDDSLLNPEINATLASNIPVGVSRPAGVPYLYAEITANFNSSRHLRQAQIGFKVNKSWYDTNNLSVDSTALLRYTGTRWQTLPTILQGEDQDSRQFSASTAEFSLFAVTATRKNTITATAVTPAASPTRTGTPSEAPSPTPTQPAALVVPFTLPPAVTTLIVLVAAIAVTAWLAKRLVGKEPGDLAGRLRSYCAEHLPGGKREASETPPLSSGGKNAAKASSLFSLKKRLSKEKPDTGERGEEKNGAQ